MAQKGHSFLKYSPELKAEAVRLYTEEKLSALRIASMLGIRSKTQVQVWVKKHLQSDTMEDLRGKTAWRKGRPKTKFSSVEEELAYIKAENEYLKKRYPNLHGE